MPTRLSDDVTKPRTPDLADGPGFADTTDPSESATSVRPDTAAAARAGYGSVNAVVPGGKVVMKTAAGSTEHGEETFEAVNHLGEQVTVTRNLDTGKTTVSGNDEAAEDAAEDDEDDAATA